MNTFQASSIHGKMKIYLEIVPGAGAWETLVRKVNQTPLRHLEGIVPVYVHASELPFFQGLPTSLGAPLDLLEEGALMRILEKEPRLIILPCLVCPDLTHEAHTVFQHALGTLMENSLTLETTLPMVAYDGVNDVLNPPINWPRHAQVNGTFLRQYVADYHVCDVPPQTLLSRYLSGDIQWPHIVAGKRAEMLNIGNLHRLREAMFSLVTVHAGDVARHLSLAGNDTGKTNQPPLIWAFRRTEMGWSLLAIFGTGLFLYAPWMAGLLSTTSVAIGMTGAALIIALHTNALSAVSASLLALTMYMGLLLCPLSGSTWPQARPDELAMLFGVATLTLIAANLRTLHESRLRVKEEYTRALLRLVYDVSYLTESDDILLAAMATLRRGVGIQVVYGQVDNGRVTLMDNMQLSDSDHENMTTAVQSGHVTAPQPTHTHGFIWCPVQAGHVVLGVLGVKHANGHTMEQTYALTDFLRTFTRLLAGAVWRVKLDKDKTEAAFLANRESLRSSLLASVSHDLKTPLVSVIGGLSTLLMLKDKIPQKERQDLIKAAYQEAQRLHRIVHNVLEMARLESGSVLPLKNPMDMVDLLNTTIARVQQVYPHARLKIIDAQHGFVALGDEILMSQVMYNLLENAAKYGPVLHEISVSLTSNPLQKTIAIQITDQGEGISPADLPHIFDKFYRSSFTDRKQAGSGLGLAICRAMVEAHSGTLEAHNRTDGPSGMVFVITLPAVAVILIE